MCDKAQKQHWVEFVLLPVECSIYRIHCIQPRCVIRFEHKDLSYITDPEVQIHDLQK